MQCSGVALISSLGPFCSLPLTHVNSFVAQFVYVQIGSHDGVVAGGGYITGGEARQTQSPSQTQPRPHPSHVERTTTTSVASVTTLEDVKKHMKTNHKESEAQPD